MSILDIFFNPQQHLTVILQQLGWVIYLLLFLIIFCETGLVVTPFLPGDSLLFAVGAIAASSGQISVWICCAILTTAAILGDSVNYSIGKNSGDFFLRKKLVKEIHLSKAKIFFDKHGPKAIFLARFAPIIRTFVPFTAGASQMAPALFLRWNILGGIVWINSFLLLGFYFGNLPFVQKQFHYVILGIVIVSVMPIFYELILNRKALSDKA